MIDATAQSSWRHAMRRRMGLLMVAGCLTLFAGCVAAPVQEMSDARQAINAAAQAGADRKATAQMQDARAALARAEDALKKVHYRTARELAQEARAKAIEAQRASE